MLAKLITKVGLCCRSYFEARSENQRLQLDITLMWRPHMFENTSFEMDIKMDINQPKVGPIYSF